MGSTSTLDVNSTDDSLYGKNRKKNYILTKIIEIKSLITIEPVICCCQTADILSAPVIYNLQLEMACKVNCGYNETICNTVINGTHASYNFSVQNGNVQEHISDMYRWSIPLQKLIPIIILLFMGSYSDRKNLRKPFLVIPLTGRIASSLCIIVCVILKEKLPVAAVGLAVTLSSCFGGVPLLSAASFSYVTDISSPDLRIIRISVINIFLNIQIPIALLSSSPLLALLGYLYLMIFSLAVYLLGIAYCIFGVTEYSSKNVVNNNENVIEKFSVFQDLKETIKFLITSGKVRGNIIFVVIIIAIYRMVNSGETTLLFLFTQHAYGWNYLKYTIYQAVESTISASGVAVSMLILSKIFKLNDLILVTISFCGKIISNIICITVKSTNGLYIGLFFNIFEPLAAAGIRSQATKYVSSSDTGKMQSVIQITMGISVLFSTEIYVNAIFSNTRNSYIQAFFYPAIVLYIFGTILLLWKIFQDK